MFWSPSTLYPLYIALTVGPMIGAAIVSQLSACSVYLPTRVIFRSTFRDIDILSLPRTPQSYIDDAVENKPEGLPCDLCREDENDAVVCCTDCKKRLCHKHAQVNIGISIIGVFNLSNQLSNFFKNRGIQGSKKHFTIITGYFLPNVCHSCKKIAIISSVFTEKEENA